VTVGGNDGINLWVPVDDENTALIRLAARGIAVAPGSPFVCARRDRAHVRITCASTTEGYENLASAVAQAAGRVRDTSHRRVNIR
jgi:DNA-binding transcriptional MocR family regulator